MAVVEGIDVFKADFVHALIASRRFSPEEIRDVVAKSDLFFLDAEIRAPKSLAAGLPKSSLSPYAIEGDEIVWRLPGGRGKDLLGDGSYIFKDAVRADAFATRKVVVGQRGAWLKKHLVGKEVKVGYSAYQYVLDAFFGGEGPETRLEKLGFSFASGEADMEFLEDFSKQMWELQAEEAFEDGNPKSPFAGMVDTGALAHAQAGLHFTKLVLSLQGWMGGKIERGRNRHCKEHPNSASSMGRMELVGHCHGNIQFATSDGLCLLSIKEAKRNAVPVFCLFTREELDRLLYSCRAFSQAYLHAHTLQAEEDAVGQATRQTSIAIELLQLPFAMFQQVALEDYEDVPAALHKFFSVYVAAMAGNSNAANYRAVKAGVEEDYPHLFGSFFDEVWDRVSNLDPTHAQDFGRLIKLFGGVDVEIPAVFAGRQSDWDNPNPRAHRDGKLLTEDEETRLDVDLERALKLVIARGLAHLGSERVHADLEDPQPASRGVGRLLKTNKEISHYLSTGGFSRDLKLVDMDDLSIDGCAKYVERSDYDVDRLKDSAVCEPNLQEVLETYATIRPASRKQELKLRRNKLTAAAINVNSPTRDEAVSSLGCGSAVHRVGWKMEPQKTKRKVRMFYIGNSEAAYIQSEMEENVHAVAQGCYGYTMGADPAELHNKLADAICAAAPSGKRRALVCMDAERWSPGMRARIQRLSHSVWDRVFGGRTPFAEAHSINENSTIVCNKRGYRFLAKCTEANLEGFNGKEMTVLHLAMLELALFRFRARDARYKDITASVFAFIDDQFMEVLVPSSWGTFEEHTSRLFDDLVETYTNFGFSISRAKCTVSEVYAQFLNEIFFESKQIGYGMRAFVHCGAQPFDDLDTIVGSVDRVLGGLAGAVKCGMNFLRAQFAAYYALGLLLLGYAGKLGPVVSNSAAVVSAYWACSPKSHAGLAVPGPIQLGSTFSGPMQYEGVRRLQYWLGTAPTLGMADKLWDLICMPVATTEAATILTGSANVSAGKGWSLYLNRGRDLARDAMADIVEDPFLISVMAVAAKDEGLDIGMDMIGGGRDLAGFMLEELAASLESAILDSFISKFVHSSTIQKISSARALRSAKQSNRREAKQLVNYFSRVIRM